MGVTLPATGTGTATPIVATEQLASNEYQLVKLIDSTAASTTRTGVAANPLQVSLANHGANSTAVKVDGSAVTQPVSYATTGSGTATGALRVELPTNGTGVIATVGAVTSITNALPAGTNAIGKLAANSGVDIGDVDITSIAAGTNTIGNVGIVPRTSGGFTTYHLVSGASTNATSVKASAGQLFGWYVYNSNASARKLVFHNTAGTPTAGASVFFSIVIPPSSGANVFTDAGIAFSTGIGITTVTGLADSDSTGVAANDLIINLFYS